MTKKKILVYIFCIIIVIITLYMVVSNYTNNLSQSNMRDNNNKQIEILTDYINIRESSSLNSEIIGKVNKNEIYNVLETNDLWIKIKTSKNLTGWIISSYNDEIYVRYLETNGNIPEEQNKLDKIANKEYLDVENIKYRKIEWISDIPLGEIKTIKDNGMMNIQPKMFITKSDELYEFSTEKKYSNEQVCKKIDTDVKFDRFNLCANDRDLSIIISLDGKYYYYQDGNFKDYFIDDPLLNEINSKHVNNYGYWQGGAITYYIYYYIEGNNIYQYKATKKDSTYTLINNDIIDTIPNGENFISLEGRIIKTDKNYYKLGVKNQEEVDKYEDVEKVFGLVKIEDISDDYNKISYFNGNYIIYKDDPNNLYIYSEY